MISPLGYLPILPRKRYAGPIITFVWKWFEDVSRMLPVSAIVGCTGANNERHAKQDGLKQAGDSYDKHSGSAQTRSGF
jgi:hypothetical protein